MDSVPATNWTARAAAISIAPHDSVTRRIVGGDASAPPTARGSLATKVTAAVSPSRTAAPSSGFALEAIRRDVIVGGVRSTKTRRSHDVTTPSDKSSPAAGHRVTSNVTGHVPAPLKHVVSVTRETPHATLAPSTNPSPSPTGTVRVTVSMASATPLSGLVARTATVRDVPSETSAPATVADATAIAVAALIVSANACPGPTTPSSSALSLSVTHEYAVPHPALGHIELIAAVARTDWIVTVAPSAKTSVVNAFACALPTTSETGPMVSRRRPSVAGIVVPTTSEYVTVS